MKIGIFDSGMGGLSVLHHARKVIPHAEFIYYADEKNVPYGEKTEEQIRGFIEEILTFLINKNVDAIIIACNTATSVATKEFRERFPVPIIGMEPAVKKAIEMYQDKRILAAATPVTIAGKKLHDLLEQVDKKHTVDLIALPKLVRFAERGEFFSQDVEDYLRAELGKFDLTCYEALVLGCTHFNYFKECFQRIFSGEIHFVDGNEGTIRQLIRRVPEVQDSKQEQTVSFYFSGEPVNEEETARINTYLKRLDEVYRII